MHTRHTHMRAHTHTHAHTRTHTHTHTVMASHPYYFVVNIILKSMLLRKANDLKFKLKTSNYTRKISSA